MAMRKKKHHYKPRRTPRPTHMSRMEGDEMFIFSTIPGLDQAAEDWEKEEYQNGSADRLEGLSMLSRQEWEANIEPMALPSEMVEMILGGMYAAYADGYNGKPFKRRVFAEAE